RVSKTRTTADLEIGATVLTVTKSPGHGTRAQTAAKGQRGVPDRRPTAPPPDFARNARKGGSMPRGRAPGSRVLAAPPANRPRNADSSPSELHFGHRAMGTRPVRHERAHHHRQIR